MEVATYVTVDEYAILEDMSDDDLLDELLKRGLDKADIFGFSKEEYYTLRELVRYKPVEQVMDFLDKKLFPR